MINDIILGKDDYEIVGNQKYLAHVKCLKGNDNFVMAKKSMLKKIRIKVRKTYYLILEMAR